MLQADASEQEMANIISAIADLRYRNEKLLEILHKTVMNSGETLGIYNLSLILNSYASLVPDKMKYFNDLAPELHDKLAAGVRTETFKLGQHL